jgi:hypothetical protein
MATKFYLRNASATGTVPTATLSATAPTQSALATNGWKSMSLSTGSGQTSKAITTLAQTAAQSAAIVAFCSDPIAAQSIVSQKINYSFGASESNSNSDFFVCFGVYLWRPSTTSIVTRIYDQQPGSEPGTSQTVMAATPISFITPATSQDGDILVCELWRSNNTQNMGNAYTNTYFYDGTTEGSTSNCASFINFPTSTISFYTPPSTSAPQPPNPVTRRRHMIVR